MTGTAVLPKPAPPGCTPVPTPSPWGHAVTHDGRETLTVLLSEPPDAPPWGWMPPGCHTYVPMHTAVCHERPRWWDLDCDCDTNTKAVVRVAAFDWLRWTRVEFTDEALFLDHLTGIEWRVRRIFPQDNPDRPEEPGFDTPRYVGYPVVTS